MTAAESVAYEFTQKSGAVLVLKGQNTVITSPDGSVFKNEGGSRALGEINIFTIRYASSPIG